MNSDIVDIEREIMRLYDILTKESVSAKALAVLADLTSVVGDHACEDYCEEDHADDVTHSCEDRCALDHVDDEDHVCEDYCDRDHVDDFGSPEYAFGIAALAVEKWMRRHGELPVEGEDLWVRDMREVMIALGRAVEDPERSSRDFNHALRYGSLALR